MQASLFLAKFFSIYLLVMGLAMLLAQQTFQQRVNALVKDQAVMLVASIIALIFGIFLILLHTHLFHDWRMLVTVLCWVVFIKGVVNILFPRVTPFIMRYFQQAIAYRIWGAVMLILAVYLGYHGFGF